MLLLGGSLLRSVGSLALGASLDGDGCSEVWYHRTIQAILLILTAGRSTAAPRGCGPEG